MSLTWEHLAKNSEDSETIEEAIQRIVDEHNDDSEAHLNEGQSLQSHKASDIIDHLAKSIITDKIAKFTIDAKHFVANRFWLLSMYENTDQWDTITQGNGDIDPIFGGIRLRSGSTTNNYSFIGTESYEPVMDDDFSFQIGLKLDSSSDVRVRWGCSANLEFKVEDGVFTFTTHFGDFDETETISTIDPTELHFYRIDWDHETKTISAFIDQELVAEHEVGVVPPEIEGFIHTDVRTHINDHKYVLLYHVMYWGKILIL